MNSISLAKFLWDKEKNILTIHARGIPYTLWSDLNFAHQYIDVCSHVTKRKVRYKKIDQVSSSPGTWDLIICKTDDLVSEGERPFPEIHIYPGG